MLSRVADALYWIGRYLERAENVCRLLIVASEVSVEVEGLDDTLAQGQWDELMEAVSGVRSAPLEFGPESGLSLPYVRRLLLDDSEIVSVRHSLGRARENARSVREVLTREVFGELNECHRHLERLRRRGLRDPVVANDELAATHRAILATLGSVEHTLSRDQGWTMMKLGEALERSQRTLLVLRAQLPSLGHEPDGGALPLYYARWRALLRSLASLENFRSARSATLHPAAVMRFLLFEPTAPRSVLCGVSRLRHYLDQLPGGAKISEADRIVGRLHATLRYDDERILARSDLAEFCGEAAAELGLVHEAIARQYFPS